MVMKVQSRKQKLGGGINVLFRGTEGSSFAFAEAMGIWLYRLAFGEEGRATQGDLE